MELLEDLGYLFPKETSKQKRRFGIYKCNCGNVFKTQIHTVKKGDCSSCGCIQKKRTSDTHLKHGKSKTRLYAIRNGIITRTENKNHGSYKKYGANGISMCDEWRNNPNDFIDWALSNGYADDLTIDRKNNDGNYEPSNCRWVNKSIQSQNRKILMATNKSGYKGVCFANKRKKWCASITVRRKHKIIGYYDDPKQAAMAYDTFVIVYGLLHTKNFQ